MAYNDGGYKITIQEKTSKEEILNAFAKILTYLEENHGVEEFGKINLYLQMYKDDERQMLVDPNTLMASEGGVTISPEKTHKTYEKLPDGSKKIIFHKTLNGKRIEDAVNRVVQKPNFVGSNSIIIAVSQNERMRKCEEIKYEEMRKKRDEEMLEARKKKEEEKLIKQRAEMAKKEEKAAILNKFKTFIADKLNCEVDELSHHTTSLGHLTDKKIIIKYLEGQLTPKNGEVFRVTYKDKETKKASIIEIYSIDFKLLNTLDYKNT